MKRFKWQARLLVWPIFVLHTADFRWSSLPLIKIETTTSVRPGLLRCGPVSYAPVRFGKVS